MAAEPATPAALIPVLKNVLDILPEYLVKKAKLRKPVQAVPIMPVASAALAQAASAHALTAVKHTAAKAAVRMSVLNVSLTPAKAITAVEAHGNIAPAANVLRIPPCAAIIAQATIFQTPVQILQPAKECTATAIAQALVKQDAPRLSVKYSIQI